MLASIYLVSSDHKKQGFALVLALALLSLVFLLVISLVNLVSTDLSLVEARKEKILAQAHARMGMRIAIGEIQKHLGPDMRISGTADLLDERIESARNFIDQTYEEDQSSQLGVDLNEDGNIDNLPFGQRFWTGVWKHRGRDKNVDAFEDPKKAGAKPLPDNLDTGDSPPKENENLNPQISTEFDPHPAIEVAWLVSGNEGATQNLYFGGENMYTSFKEFVEIPDINTWDTDQPDNGRAFIKGEVYGEEENAWKDYTAALLESDKSPINRGFDQSLNLPGYNHPIYRLPDPEDSDEVEWMLKAPLLDDEFDLEKPDSWKDHLKAEPVKVRKTRIQHDQKEDPESKYGAYAYWVGDEGVKSKASIYNPFKESDDPQKKSDNISVATEPNLSFAFEEDEGAGFGLDWDSDFREEQKDNLLSLGMLANEVADAIEVAPFYHSLSTDSYGVLSDVRTGGLKRDLSSVFANTDNWAKLMNTGDEWVDDFSDYIYKQRIFYQKSVPLDIQAKENLWHRGSDQVILERYAMLAGPRWSVLGSFHNLYLKSDYRNITPEYFPRIVGDNFALFNHLFPAFKPHSPGNKMDKNLLPKYFNYFKGIASRPEPKIHPVQPVLLEIKYSHHPVFDQGELGLAVYPSVAFWNPYNKAITLDEMYIELPLTVTFSAFNAKHLDYSRRWYLKNNDPVFFGDYVEKAKEGGKTPPSSWKPPRIKFHDRNKNGKQDPGEKSYPPRPEDEVTGGDEGNTYQAVALPNELRWWRNYFEKAPFWNKNLDWITGDPNWDFGVSKLGGRISRKFLYSEDSDSAEENHGKRHLLLRIENLQLDPGEKSHFTVGSNQVISYTPLPESGKETSYINVNLTKLNSGYEDTPVLFLCGNNSINSDDPVAIRYTYADLRGVHPNSTEAFSPEGMREEGNSELELPKGITLYSESPEGVNYNEHKIIGKINKTFEFQDQDPAEPEDVVFYEKCEFLEIPQKQTLPGCGFRIRFKLPAKTDKIVFEQFNIRALIHSNQEGYGDNWDLIEYNSHKSNEIDPLWKQGEKNGFPQVYPAFFDDNLVEKPDDQVSGFSYQDPNYGIIPVAKAFDAFVGFFHDFDEIDQMQSEENAVMFELPNSPLLSIFQLRHVNLNNYSHGPSYALGNSYASTQVPRYKTWGKMKAFDRLPVMNVAENLEMQQAAWEDGYEEIYFDWSPETRMMPDQLSGDPGDHPFRDPYVGKDHQNIVLDHSYYLNYALMDGYFMSGLGIGDEWQLEDSDETEPGARFLPFRNPRFLPFYREGEWKQTSYSEKNENASGSDSQFRYQTLAADILVNGQFNVNSTSVDAWVSQLSSLRGKDVKGVQISSEKTPVPRFLEYKNPNTWNTLRELSDAEINLLAFKIVEQVKLRGPFLSYADFVNRRLQGIPINTTNVAYEEWEKYNVVETRSSTLGLRGAIQAAISESKLNSGYDDQKLYSQDYIPTVPDARFFKENVNALFPALPSEMKLKSFAFGIHAISKDKYSYPSLDIPQGYFPLKENVDEDDVNLFKPSRKWGRGVHTPQPDIEGPHELENGTFWQITEAWQEFKDTFSYGSAPDNLLAVENVATGANKPGWVMQSDLLSPLAPVTAVRSDTFVIRVMGEIDVTLNDTVKNNSTSTKSKAWIELTVQRVPDYISTALDNPHHRSHEPFEDRNFNGYYNPEIKEHWIDLNQDSIIPNGDGDIKVSLDASYPNLPGTNTFADGLKSDIPLSLDPTEEDADNKSVTVSRMGVNQRFGRKFKIIKFRWLKAQDV
jgi:hypothetical protein